LPVFLSDRVFHIARRVKRFLRNPKKTVRRRLEKPENASQHRRTKSKKAEFKQFRREVKRRRQEEHEQLKTEIAKIENEIEDKKQEIKRIGIELRATEDPAERLEHERRKQRINQERSRLIAELRMAKENERATNTSRKKWKKTLQQEIFWLEREQRAVSEELGTLPDFLIIGEKKCGTSFFYHLLTQHPYVEPAAKKELHFFDRLFDAESVDWYRRCFPQPSWKEGRRTITGEATPYMSHPLAPQRIAGVVPQARLIALLRNPVDRAYSDYQMRVRKGRENRTFEEAIGAAEKVQPPGDEGEAHADLAVARQHGLLSKGVYVDRLLRWSQFFPREQMLVLKSEDFFESPQETLKRAFDFLGLPEWEPEVSKVGKKRNAGSYEEEMDPVLRRRLEEYFELHNKRLYDYLGTDFGW
jgi:sulfotransferase family protein